MMNSIKDDIDERLSGLTVSDNLKYKIIFKSQVKRFPRRRYAAGIIAACLCLVLFIGSAIGNTTLFQKVSDMLGGSYEGEIIQAIPPKEGGTENKGIKMEVVGALNDGDMAMVYIVVQDLEKDRLDETFRFNELDFSDDSIKNIASWDYDVIDYDAETKSLIIRAKLSGENLDGQEINLDAKSFYSKEENFEDIPLFSSLDEYAENEAEYIPVGKEFVDEGGKRVQRKYLKTDVLNEPIEEIRDDGGGTAAYLSNIGMIDGNLHIQFKYEAKGIRQCHASLGFEKDGAFIGYGASLEYFTVNEKGHVEDSFNEILGENGVYYEEIIVDIDDMDLEKEELKNISLNASFAVNRVCVDGEWNLNFKIKAVDEVKKAETSIHIGDLRVTKVTLSPIGVTMRGISKDGDFSYPLKVEVNYGAKTIQLEEEGSYWYLDESKTGMDNTMIRFVFRDITDITKVKSMQINDEIIYFQ